jgi:hypothetical protein
MGGACSTDGRDEQCIQYFVGKPSAKIHLEDVGVDGKIILEWILGK